MKAEIKKRVRQPGPGGGCLWACIASVAGVKYSNVRDRANNKAGTSFPVIAKLFAQWGYIIIPCQPFDFKYVPGLYLSIVAAGSLENKVGINHALLVHRHPDKCEVWDPLHGKDAPMRLGQLYLIQHMDEPDLVHG